MHDDDYAKKGAMYDVRGRYDITIFYGCCVIRCCEQIQPSFSFPDRVRVYTQSGFHWGGVFFVSTTRGD